MLSEVTDIINEIIHKPKANISIPKRILENLRSLELKINQLQILDQDIQKLPSTRAHTTQQLNQDRLQRDTSCSCLSAASMGVSLRSAQPEHYQHWRCRLGASR